MDYLTLTLGALLACVPGSLKVIPAEMEAKRGVQLVINFPLVEAQIELPEQWAG